MKELKVLTKYESNNVDWVDLFEALTENEMIDLNLHKQIENLLNKIDSEEDLEDDQINELVDNMLYECGYKSLAEMLTKNINLEYCNIVRVNYYGYNNSQKYVEVYPTNNYKEALLEYIYDDKNYRTREVIAEALEEDQELYETIEKMDADDLDFYATRDFGQTKEAFKLQVFGVCCDFDYDAYGNINEIYVEDIITHF